MALKSVKNEFIKSTSDTCPICKTDVSISESQCPNKHILNRCILTKKIIYLDEFYECKACQFKYTTEALKSYQKIGIDLNFSCIVCFNLLKKV